MTQILRNSTILATTLSLALPALAQQPPAAPPTAKPPGELAAQLACYQALRGTSGIEDYLTVQPMELTAPTELSLIIPAKKNGRPGFYAYTEQGAAFYPEDRFGNDKDFEKLGRRGNENKFWPIRIGLPGGNVAYVEYQTEQVADINLPSGNGIPAPAKKGGYVPVSFFQAHRDSTTTSNASFTKQGRDKADAAKRKATGDPKASALISDAYQNVMGEQPDVAASQDLLAEAIRLGVSEAYKHYTQHAAGTLQRGLNEQNHYLTRRVQLDANLTTAKSEAEKQSLRNERALLGGMDIKPNPQKLATSYLKALSACDAVAQDPKVPLATRNRLYLELEAQKQKLRLKGPDPTPEQAVQAVVQPKVPEPQYVVPNEPAAPAVHTDTQVKPVTSEPSIYDDIETPPAKKAGGANVAPRRRK